MSDEDPRELFAPLRKTLHLRTSKAQAFARFAEGFNNWWPRHLGHSVFGERSSHCLLEPRSGGRILEFDQDGGEAEWGVVTAWEPPARLAFHWYPGRDAETAQRVEVTFTADAKGTLIELIHHDWHLLGAQAEPSRERYDSGWDQVLGTFGAHSSRATERAAHGMTPRGRVVSQRLTVKVPIARAWALLTTAEGMNQWFTSDATVDPAPGGRLVFRWDHLPPGAGPLELFGRVRRYEPERCFAFDWQADSGTYDLYCQIDFESVPEGTRIVLEETGFQDTPLGLQDLLNRQGGWAQELTALRVFAEHGIRL
ncbi:MAG: SRPBCC family protein [Pseudomonadota bacterium]